MNNAVDLDNDKKVVIDNNRSVIRVEDDNHILHKEIAIRSDLIGRLGTINSLKLYRCNKTDILHTLVAINITYHFDKYLNGVLVVDITTGNYNLILMSEDMGTKTLTINDVIQVSRMDGTINLDLEIDVECEKYSSIRIYSRIDVTERD